MYDRIVQSSAVISSQTLVSGSFKLTHHSFKRKLLSCRWPNPVLEVSKTRETLLAVDHKQFLRFGLSGQEYARYWQSQQERLDKPRCLLKGPNVSSLKIGDEDIIH